MPEPPSNGNAKSDHVPTRPHGLCAGCAAYAAPALCGAGVRLLDSVRHAHALSEVARSLASA